MCQCIARDSMINHTRRPTTISHSTKRKKKRRNEILNKMMPDASETIDDSSTFIDNMKAKIEPNMGVNCSFMAGNPKNNRKYRMKNRMPLKQYKSQKVGWLVTLIILTCLVSKSYVPW